MKSESSIRKQINRLRKVVDRCPNGAIKHEAYEAYHALRWVIEKVDWNPAKLAENRAAKNGH